ncbi:MAG: hypothetical protein JO011_08970 [Ktedonobacteraceae bacterium]|nr:hypothetical protein [Ktedonobacteraceae bacterium]MBV9711031.1 hypothetical protein [Ktedonobacteraceae bacterium]
MNADPLLPENVPPSYMPDTTPSYVGPTERFQYASCPQCHTTRARLTKQIRKSWHLFSIFCPFCGYEDADVSDR